MSTRPGDGVFAKDWSFADGITTYTEVPEPGTLVILGLATIGLPVVRRL